MSVNALYMKKVYKIWSNAQEKKLTILPSGLSLNDVWSLFLTHWLTDKVVYILAFSVYITYCYFHR